MTKRGTWELLLTCPTWFSNSLQGGLQCPTLKKLLPFVQAVIEIPSDGETLKRELLMTQETFNAAVRMALPRVKGDQNGYAIARATVIMHVLRRWIVLLYDQGGPVPAASRVACEYLGSALRAHSLFTQKEAQIRLLQSKDSPEQAITDLVHEMDRVYLSVLPFGSGVTFHNRIWEFGETAVQFFESLRVLAGYENHDDAALFARFGQCCITRRDDPEVADPWVVNGIVDHFVLGIDTSMNIELFVGRMANSSHGRIKLTRRHSQRGREGRVLLSEDLQMIDDDDFHCAAQMRGLTFVAEPHGGSQSGGSDAYLTAAQKRPCRALDLPKLAECGIITGAFAEHSWNAKRADGLWGVDCACNINGKYTEEYSIEEFKAKYGKHPFKPTKIVQAHQVIVHIKEECWLPKSRAEKAVTEGKAESSVTKPLDWKALLERRMASKSAQGC